jgi:hypothetical protein
MTGAKAMMTRERMTRTTRMSEYLVWSFFVGLFSYLAARILDRMWANYYAAQG